MCVCVCVYVCVCVCVCVNVLCICACSLRMSIRLGLPDIERPHIMRLMYVYVSSQAIPALSVESLGPRLGYPINNTHLVL